MIIIQRPNQTRSKELALTMGFFDGVHLGHRELVQEVSQSAVTMGLESAVLTFWPHPRLVLHKDPEKLRFLNTLNEKAKIIAKMGIDYLIVQEFSKEFFNLDAAEFIKILVNDYKVKYFVVGADHRFGKGGAGNANLLNKLSGEMDFTVKVLPSLKIDGVDISSTKIRDALLSGNLNLANQMLGYPYLITGAVQTGNQIGRKIGFPTANIRPNDPLKLIPKEGVYAVIINVNGSIYKGMLNIGYRPTLETNSKQTIEVNIFDFEEDLYHTGIEIALISRLRDEKRFPSIEHLKEQLVIDKQNALEVLKDQKTESFQNLFLTLRP
ncbi:MAG TPA: riboflavin biosynthesis protein RibF [Bacteroidales bacterium]|nr:riboflavin biosynthesis protein RibF [Bacteroidales bacterium]